MWKAINASVTGTSHLNSGNPCQDKSIVHVWDDRNGDQRLICLAADGAGSAAEGGRGAQLACTVGMAFLKSAMADGHILNTRLIIEMVDRIRLAVLQEAEKTNRSSREFASTFVGGILGKNMSFFFQIGDGAIVVSKNKSHGIVFWPDCGQYANMTHFITDDDALENLQIEISNTTFDDMAILSDGLQYLALNFKHQIPHLPFFLPMLDTLRQMPWDQIDLLKEKLVHFLEGKDVNERTDDDKTLILAVKIDS